MNPASRLDAAIFCVVLLILVMIVINAQEIADLRCRVARMETLAVSAEPLPECEEEADEQP